MKRQAVLFGVPHYDSPEIEDLPFVTRDVDILREALESSKYVVKSKGGGDGPSLTQNNLRQGVRAACRDAPQGSILILYFSGHGIHYGGMNYLIPSDATFDDDPMVIPQYLVPIDFAADVIDASQAETILFFIDACREGVKLVSTPDRKAVAMGLWGGGQIATAKKRESAYVFSCGPGGYSYFAPGDSGFSLFTGALAAVLSSTHPATTFGEVRQALQETLTGLSQSYGKPAQTVRVFGEFDAGETLNTRIICDGTPERTRNTRNQYSWVDAADKSYIWTICSSPTESMRQSLKENVHNLVSAAEKQHENFLESLQDDPWHDADFPLRVLERVEFLSKESVESLDLSIPEAAVLVASPFVHEGIKYAILSKAVAANALCLDGIHEPKPLRTSLDRFLRSIPRPVDKALRLEAEGEAAAYAVKTWILHRWVSTEPDIWLPDTVDSIEPTFRDVIQTAAESTLQVLDLGRLLEVCQCVSANAERIEHVDRTNALMPKRIVCAGTVAETQIREKLLAHLVALAGRMAIEVGSLSSILVDHVSTSDPLDPRQAVATLVASSWVPVAEHRALTAVCDHPALDVALRDHVNDAEQILKSVQRKAQGEQDGFHVLRRLPARLTVDGLKPTVVDGKASYKTPHLRFRLAHDEIRELLMGEKIYGDPSLAIRELYQNALDACRYRQARLEYLKRTGRTVDPWRGSILFKQGRDEGGRAYIECSDNGIGMGHSELTEIFSRAGRRFTDTAEFREERSTWLNCAEPVLFYPNSQFGIGVFSYFMLADEILIETCRMDRDGRLGERLVVKVSTGGSLFRIRPDGKGAGAGTRITLYLMREEFDSKPISCADTLAKLLWVADYDTIVETEGRRIVWEPDKLRLPLNKEGNLIRPRRAVNTAFRAGAAWRDDVVFKLRGGTRPSSGRRLAWTLETTDPRFWWFSQEEGQLLADGIVTDNRIDFAVLNLRDEFTAELSVDRRRIQRYDKNHVANSLAANVTALASCPDWLDYEWLWEFAECYPELVDGLIAELAARNVHVRISNAEKSGKGLQSRPVNVAIAGCLPQDRHVIECLKQRSCHTNVLPLGLLALRCATFAKAGLRPAASEGWAETSRFPSPTTNEWQATLSVILSQGLNGRPPWLRSAVGSRHILLASVVLGKPVQEILNILAEYAELLDVDLSTTDPSVFPDGSPWENDRAILSEGLNGAGPWIKGKVTWRHLLYAAVKLRTSLPVVIFRLERYSLPLSLKLPSFDRSLLPETPVDEMDPVILSKSLDGRGPRIEGEISIAHVIIAAVRLRTTPFRVLERLELYSHLLGFKTPSIPNLSASQAIGEPDDRVLLSRRLNGSAPWLEGAVSIGHLLRASAKLQCSVGEALERLRRYRSILGLNLESIEASTLPTAPPDEFDRALLSLRLDGESPWLSGRVPTAHVLAGAAKLEISIGAALERMRSYAPLIGLKLPNIEPAYLLDRPGREYTILLSANLDGHHPWIAKEVSVRHVLRAAAVRNEPVKEVVGRLRKYARLLKLDLPRVRQSRLPSDPPDPNDCVILSRRLDGKSNWRTSIDGGHLLAAAASLRLPLSTVYERLRRYDSLISIQLPSFPDELSAERPPQETDCIILSYHLDGERPWVRRITGYHVFAAAAKLRLSTRRVLERMEVYSSLLGLDLSYVGGAALVLDSSPDRIDRIILSVDPEREGSWITDDVAPGHIVRAAHKLNRSLSFVIERLKTYSSLLNLKLPDVIVSDLLESIPDKTDCLVCSANLDGSPPWLRREVRESHLRAACWITGESESRMRSRIERLRPIGLTAGPRA